jgi:hypothetical protein
MSKKAFLRAAAVVAGASMMAGVAGLALADDVVGEPETVEISVTIADIPPTGALVMSVASNATTLTETGSSPLLREFTGDLPVVTVTDTRDQDTLTDDTGWAVLGTAEDFEHAVTGTKITADHLGWLPELLTPLPNQGTGEVTEGDVVLTSMDTPTTNPPNNVGLVDQELLVIAAGGSASANPDGEWTVGADLFLKTPVNVEAGTYTSDLTLTLME